jgi:hypothetical protein
VPNDLEKVKKMLAVSEDRRFETNSVTKAPLRAL